MEDKIKSPWPGPEGLIPVTNGKAEDANKINRQYLDDLLVEMRVIDAVEPNLETEIFGRRFSSPIMMPAFSHLNKVGKDGRKPMEEYAMAAEKLNVLNWVEWSLTMNSPLLRLLACLRSASSSHLPTMT